MFDEQPDDDPHGECAAEIHRLNEENDILRAALEWYATEARALAENMTAKKDMAVLASVNVLALDAGKRASDVLTHNA